MSDVKFAWHIYHDTLLSPLCEPIENRIAFIKNENPLHEQELRLRLLKPVQGKLPDEYVKAWDEYARAMNAYDKAWDDPHDKASSWNAYDKAWGDDNKAWIAYAKARTAHMPEILALHAIECPDCTWDGKTIFPEGGVK